ncbi:MAG: tRNA uridine-5-carboxymethylaminomethyl(34) synthesis enzyme MnmG, partial [Synergistetes bacterium]|nr:tRNA uridine-5-carboxymethylaminomethyl(34) synthesis enzyme MnmG [Synergistota bacterium]
KLTESLRKLGIKIGRLKTGTCPRVHSDTIDYSNLTIQESADTPLAFSIYSEKRVYSGYPCWLTRSTNKTHDIIRVNLDRSPLFTGVIEGVGPRYCPSIEDRVTKFPDRDSHPIFLEPTGRRTKEIYLQNFTTSLPLDAQVKMVRSIPGLENAEIMRPGYAIEYDFAPPTQLKPSLESKIIRGLFLAGQINGTSGYEEAAGQGIIAGINAVQYIKGEPPFIPDRSEAYIGVMIDDLVTKGVKEPYRMMTSRAEYRLLIRQDNADLRMVPYGYKFGMVPRYIYERILRKKKRIAEEIERLKHTKIPPTDKVNEILRSKESSPIDETTTIYRLLKRPEINYKDIMMFDPNLSSYEEDVYEEVEIEIKYEGYIQKQNKLVEQFRKLEDKLIPEWIDYDKVPGLLTEAREKLKTIRPRSLGQASRIEGVNPADISVLMVYLSASKRKTA